MREKFWVAEFEIEPTRGDVQVESVDFLAMAASSARAPGLRRLALSEFAVGDPARHGGAMYLEVRGRDQVGFLAELLGQLAFLTFFPEEMIVQTSGDQVFDRFLLKGVAGQVPHPGACQALSKWLEGLRAS
jgi:UTP:GlnB (protein PII) uridylyltransferase